MQDVNRVWLNQYHSSVPQTIDPDSINALVDIIEKGCESYANDVAFSNFGQTLTYKEIDTYSRHFAAYLQAELHMTKGERVAIMMPNCLQYPVSLFGVLRAGMAVVNVNPLYTATELAHQLNDSEATTIVVMANFANVLEEALPQTRIKHVIVTQMGDLIGGFKGPLINFVLKHIKKMVPHWHIPKAVAFKQVLKRGTALPYERLRIVGDDVAFLQYTGGTTGRSKGAVLTHRNIVANILQATAWMKPVGELRGQGGIITALPLYHIFSLTANCLSFFALGVENILITNPRDMKGFIKELNRRPFCVLTGVNTLFNGLLHTPGFDKVDFRHFRFTLGGGMAVQKAVAERWQQVTGVPIIEAYGLTETSPAVTINPLDLKAYNGSIGLPISSTDVAIMDEKGHILPAGEVGEICVKGPQVMHGYWQRPEETEAVFNNGWFKTGDMAIMDEQGFVRIVDRKKDMIIVSGFNVYPNEVEDVLVAHASIKEVAVVGVPHAESGELVKAYIVPSDPTLTEAEVIAHCRQSLTAYKVPKCIEFRTELPKTNVGKVLRRALRDEALVKKAGEQAAEAV